MKDLVKKGEVDTLKEAMEQGIQEGCQTFDYVLLELYKQGRISVEQALVNADSANNLRLKIKLEGMKDQTANGPPMDGAPAQKPKPQGTFQIKSSPTPGSPIRKP